jgi:hypothetical protein
MPPHKGVMPSTNLIPPLTSFIGRIKELTEIKSLLNHTRLLTLTGVGGCGKTRLAMQVATGFLTTKSYPDGCSGYFAHPAGLWGFSEGISSGDSSFPSKLGSVYFMNTHWENVWKVVFRKTHRSQATTYNSSSDLDHRSIFFTPGHFALDLKRYGSVQISCT